MIGDIGTETMCYYLVATEMEPPFQETLVTIWLPWSHVSKTFEFSFGWASEHEGWTTQHSGTWTQDY